MAKRPVSVEVTNDEGLHGPETEGMRLRGWLKKVESSLMCVVKEQSEAMRTIISLWSHG